MKYCLECEESGNGRQKAIKDDPRDPPVAVDGLCREHFIEAADDLIDDMETLIAELKGEIAELHQPVPKRKEALELYRNGREWVVRVKGTFDVLDAAESMDEAAEKMVKLQKQKGYQ